MSGDSAPSREAREGSAGRAARSVALRGREGGGTAELGDELQNCLRASGGGGDKPHVLAPLAFGGNNTAGPIDVATARNACASASGRMDFETETFLVQPAHTLRGEGFDASEDGTGRGTPLVPVGFNTRQDPDCWHDRTGPLDTDGSTQAIAFSCKDYGSDAGELSPTPRAMGHGESHANAGGQVAVAFAENGRAEVRLEGGDGRRCGAISTGGGKPGQGVPMIAPTMQVRRLTPRECARLQGFPDDYLDIPYRNKPAADGPKYKALGNSWAVPVVRWIGERIQRAVDPT